MARGTNPTTEMTRAALPAEAEADAAPEGKRRGPKKGMKRRKRGKRGGLTRSHAVALCVEKLGGEAAQPADIARMLKDEFKIDLKNTNISQYKSLYLKKLREGGDRATSDSVSAVVAPKTKTREGVGGSVSVSEIRQLKDLAKRMGEKGFRELVELILE
jgi:hypothetical protein